MYQYSSYQPLVGSIIITAWTRRTSGQNIFGIHLLIFRLAVQNLKNCIKNIFFLPSTKSSLYFTEYIKAPSLQIIAFFHPNHRKSPIRDQQCMCEECRFKMTVTFRRGNWLKPKTGREKYLNNLSGPGVCFLSESLKRSCPAELSASTMIKSPGGRFNMWEGIS